MISNYFYNFINDNHHMPPIERRDGSSYILHKRDTTLTRIFPSHEVNTHLRIDAKCQDVNIMATQIRWGHLAPAHYSEHYVDEEGKDLYTIHVYFNFKLDVIKVKLFNHTVRAYQEPTEEEIQLIRKNATWAYDELCKFDKQRKQFLEKMVPDNLTNLQAEVNMLQKNQDIGKDPMVVLQQLLDFMIPFDRYTFGQPTKITESYERILAAFKLKKIAIDEPRSAEADGNDMAAADHGDESKQTSGAIQTPVPSKDYNEVLGELLGQIDALGPVTTDNFDQYVSLHDDLLVNYIECPIKDKKFAQMAINAGAVLDKRHAYEDLLFEFCRDANFAGINKLCSVFEMKLPTLLLKLLMRIVNQRQHFVDADVNIARSIDYISSVFGGLDVNSLEGSIFANNLGVAAPTRGGKFGQAYTIKECLLKIKCHEIFLVLVRLFPAEGNRWPAKTTGVIEELIELGDAQLITKYLQHGGPTSLDEIVMKSISREVNTTKCDFKELAEQLKQDDMASLLDYERSTQKQSYKSLLLHRLIVRKPELCEDEAFPDLINQYVQKDGIVDTMLILAHALISLPCFHSQILVVNNLPSRIYGQRIIGERRGSKPEFLAPREKPIPGLCTALLGFYCDIAGIKGLSIKKDKRAYFRQHIHKIERMVPIVIATIVQEVCRIDFNIEELLSYTLKHKLRLEEKYSPKAYIYGYLMLLNIFLQKHQDLYLSEPCLIQEHLKIQLKSIMRLQQAAGVGCESTANALRVMESYKGALMTAYKKQSEAVSLGARRRLQQKQTLKIDPSDGVMKESKLTKK